MNIIDLKDEKKRLHEEIQIKLKELGDIIFKIEQVEGVKFPSYFIRPHTGTWLEKPDLENSGLEE